MQSEFKGETVRHFILLSSLVFLTACATEEEPVPPPVVEEIPIPSPPPEIIQEVEPEPEPLPDPDTLLQKSPADIVTLLGDPGLVRWEGNVQVFQYDNQDCVLDMVFIEQESGGFLLSYYETRSVQSAERVDAPLCLDALLKEREAVTSQ